MKNKQEKEKKQTQIIIREIKSTLYQNIYFTNKFLYTLSNKKKTTQKGLL